MKFSITRLEQKEKLLAEEIKEQLTEKQGINEMEKMMRELVKEAAGIGIAQAIEQDGWFNMEERKEDGLLDTP